MVLTLYADFITETPNPEQRIPNSTCPSFGLMKLPTKNISPKIRITMPTKPTINFVGFLTSTSGEGTGALYKANILTKNKSIISVKVSIHSLEVKITSANHNFLAWLIGIAFGH